MNTELKAYLELREVDYSPARRMVGNSQRGGGYHTRIADGTWVHSTRANFEYAFHLLASGEAGHLSRAHDVIAAGLSLQDVNPVNSTYGIWPYFTEESLAEMAPPDWNWADFCGALIADMLVRFPDRLPAALAEQMRTALGHAAWSIFRRNVGPDYTNIAIMGAGVTAAAGEILHEPRLLDYGRRRLARFIAHTEFHGGLNEYNSPCYIFVALTETERILMLVQDAEIRRDAETLHRLIWASLSEHFHPATGQLAGPHSRTYSDLLSSSAAAYLAAQTGVDIHRPTGQPTPPPAPSTVIPLPCPEPLRNRFRKLPQPELTVTSRFIRREPDERSTRGTTWLNEAACLGSINADTFWTQRRPLIGYWLDADGQVSVLRARFLRNGKDFASAAMRSSQQGSRLLAAVQMITDQGDHHCHLDRPSDGIFPATDFRLRIELHGVKPAAVPRPDGSCELRNGSYHAIVHPLPGFFNGLPVRWETGETNGQAWLDAIGYAGVKADFRFGEFGETILGFGLEILPAGREGSTATPAWSRQTDGRACFTWDALPGMSITSAAHPHRLEALHV